MQVIVGLESEAWYFCLKVKVTGSREVVVGRVADVLMLGSPAAPSTSISESTTATNRPTPRFNELLQLAAFIDGLPYPELVIF
jgi:hypothetical protein